MPTLILAFMAQLLFGVKWIAHCWDHPYGIFAEANDPLGRLILWFRWSVDGWLLRRADLVVLNILEEVLAPMHLRRDRVHAEKNGVLTAHLSRISENVIPQPYLLGVVAYVAKTKRSDFALRALAELRKMLPEAKLRLIGEVDATYENEMLKMIRELDLDGAVEITGWHPYDTAMRLAAECSVLLYCYPDIPRLRWNYVLKIGEAYALGRPVVAVDLPGSRALVRNAETGFLCDINSPADMAEKAMLILKGKELWERMAANALETAEYLDWNAVCDRINVRIQNDLSTWARCGNGK